MYHVSKVNPTESLEITEAKKRLTTAKLFKQLAKTLPSKFPLDPCERIGNILLVSEILSAHFVIPRKMAIKFTPETFVKYMTKDQLIKDCEGLIPKEGLIQKHCAEKIFNKGFIGELNLKQLHIIDLMRLISEEAFLTDFLQPIKPHILEEIKLINRGSINLLYLSNNTLTDGHLARILSEIKNPSSIKQLYMWNNQFTHLPESLCDLFELQKIEASGNKIKTLPRRLICFTNLNLFDLQGNPLTEAAKVQIRQYNDLQCIIRM